MPRPADLPPDLPDPALFAQPQPLRSSLPLQGLTVLAVEDSRYASDALRLMCQRSGARLRRAESLAVAQAHLRCYRPDVVIVDLGLPDGRGEGLIRSLVQAGRMVVLGTSGDPDGRRAALAAGASGFLDKPVPGLAVFQALILSQLAGGDRRPGPVPGQVRPDPLALTDDLIQAVAVIEADPEPGPDRRSYLAGFLSGLARQSQDGALDAASAALRDPAGRTAQVSALLRARIAAERPFQTPA